MTPPPHLAPDVDVDVEELAQQLVHKPATFASAKAMFLTMVAATGGIFGTGVAYARLETRLERASTDAAAAHSAATALERSQAVPALEARVARVEEHDAELVSAVRAIDERQRRSEINSFVTCTKLGGAGRCIPPIVASAAAPIP